MQTPRKSTSPGSSAQPETAAAPTPASADSGDQLLVTARIKWFDPTRGFGFLVSDQCEGDILVHFTVLREHGRRSLPEGARCECLVARQERGLQAVRLISIDLSEAITPPRAPPTRTIDRADRRLLSEEAGEFEAVEVKWFNRLKGYGFLQRLADEQDVFVHMETVRQSGLAEPEPEQRLEARIAQGTKGLMAVDLRAAR